MPQKKIVIADDDSLIRMDLRAQLESLGYEVVGEADNGEDVCHLVRRLRPDLAILDVMMPRKSGLEAAAIISNERLAPVVLLTAYLESTMIEEATRSGVLAYLVKPFRLQDLQPTLEIAVARYRELLALESERDELTEQMESRKVVGRAKAILMERLGLSEREAFRRLQAQSLTSSKSLREIADAIILTEDLGITGVALTATKRSSGTV